MLKRVIYEGLTWVDINAPSSEEISQISGHYNLHQLTASELLSESLRPKLDIHSDYLYVILHFIDDAEIDFIIGADYLITVHYRDNERIHQIMQHLSSGKQALSAHGEAFSAVTLFHYIVKSLYDELGSEFTRIRAHLKKVEESVYSGQERQMVLDLARVGKELLDLNQSLDQHKEVLRAFSHEAPERYGAELARYCHALLGEHAKLSSRLKRLSALHGELRATNDSLLSIKQNTIMQNFTIVAFITLIPSLLASIFGMNARHMPLVGHPLDFWLLIVLMLGSTLVIYAIFKLKKIL